MLSLPFSRDEFLAVFGRYNDAIGPFVPWLLAALAFLVVVGVVRARSSREQHAASRVALAVLAGLWAWAAVVYHWQFFRSVNPAATLFAALFALQAILLAHAALASHAFLAPGRAGDPRAWVGGAIVLYALIGYPLAALIVGHRPPLAPTFGAPCPVVLLTLGLFTWMRPRVPWRLLLVPLGWAALGSSAALQLGMWEDLALPLAAVGVLLFGRRADARREGAITRPLAA